MPRSLHGDRFNHDTEVDGYDADVADESNPIRDGYDATLAAVIAAAAAQPGDTVVDLGTGTGNLAVRLPPVGRLVCVDISAGMLAAARPKLPAATEYLEADLLEFAERVPAADAIVSTYALHHLTGGEKPPLLSALARALRPGGRLAIGDLMVRDATAGAALRTELAHADVDECFAEEFPWLVDVAVAELERLGLAAVAADQTGVLSWVLRATKR